MSSSSSAMTAGQIKSKLADLPGWQHAGNEIAKQFSFKNHYETIAFVNAVAWLSHREDHHPDMEVGYNKCKVRYSTHSAGGVTERDVDCAELVEKLMKN
jgi:4a-hydroxytetrahydrobiopterin dehydratase